MSKALKMLLEVEEKMAQGRAPSLNDPDEASAFCKMSAFLREYRARTDYAQVLLLGRRTEFIEKLERLRNALFVGDLAESGKLFGELLPASDLERAEVELERTRFLLLQGRGDDALQASEALLRNPALSDLSRITCLQLRGHRFIQKKMYREAIQELRLGASLAEFYPQVGSGFSSWAFLVQAYSELGDKEEAARALGALIAKVEEIDDPELALDRMLTLIRSEVHFYRCFDSREEFLSAVLESREIARWIGDSVTVEKCEVELAQFEDEAPAQLKVPPVSRFSGWTFLPGRELILREAPKSIFRLSKKPILNQVLVALSQGPLQFDELFQKVWPARYHPEKHATHLRVTLSNLRKVLPKGALSVEDGTVHLR